MTSFRCGTLGVALLSLGSLSLTDARADTISTWNGGSGNWSTAGQWTPASVPNNTAGQSYDVTIGSGSATLDISPTIQSFTLDGGLAQGYNSSGQYTTLTVNGHATVNGGISGSTMFGWSDSLVVGGNLTNAGYMAMGNTLSVAGNLNNSGTLTLIADSGPFGTGFDIGGRVVNTGTLNFGTPDGVYYAGVTFAGPIVNKGSIFIANGSSISGGATTDIPKGASWTIAGQFGGFSGLTGIEGTLDVEGTQDAFGNSIPLVIGSTGKTIDNSGSFTIGAHFGSSVVNLLGNLSNSGNLAVAVPGMLPEDQQDQFGPSTLNIAGTLTNGTAGTLNVNNPNVPSLNTNPSPGSLNAQKLVNYGVASFQAGTTSTAQFLQNNGTLNVFGDAAGDIGSLTVGTLKPAAGLVEVWNNGGLLVVGSGAVPAGTTGYYQLANGVLDEAGGAIEVLGNASLNGTLDIMLGDGSKPIGTVFDILTAEQPGALTGAFSNVQGLVFDDGREKYLLDYSDTSASLTVEANTTPEPDSMFLVLLGIGSVFLTGGARKRSR